jgi:hypothetical protein
MRLKTNLVVGLVFVGLLGYVYLFEVKKRDEQREAAEKSGLLLDIEEDDVAKLTIDKGDTVIVLESRQDGWWLTQPVADLADDAAVGRLIRNLGESERERVIADSASIADAPDKAAQYQLQPPRLEVTVETKEQAPTPSATIRYGAENPTDTYVYVQQAGENPEVFTVRAWRYDNVDKGLFELRDRRVLNFDAEEVREFEITYGADRIAGSRADEDSWRLTLPEAAADGEAVDELLQRLGRAKIARFVDETSDAAALVEHGLDRPMLTLVLTVGEDRAEKRLTVSGDSELPGGGRLAVDASRTPVFEIDSTLVSQIQVTAFDLREKEPMNFDKNSVTRIEFNGTHSRFVAARDTSATWSILEPEAVGAKTWVLNGFLSDLKLLKVVEFAGDNVPDGGMKEFGLNDPIIRVELFAGDEQVLGLAVGGNRDQETYVRRIGDRSVFAMGGEKVRGLDLELADVWDKREVEAEVHSPGTSAEDSTSVGSATD